MKSLRSKSLAVLLGLVMVILMGTMHVSLASHVIDHVHHTGMTHSTGVCAWMCMAAQSISTDPHTFNQTFLPMGKAEVPAPSSMMGQRTFLLPSRAPPLLLPPI